MNVSWKELYGLSPEQTNSIEESRAQFGNGQGLEHKDVVQELTTWLQTC